jgi:hypothetical protein
MCEDVSASRQIHGQRVDVRRTLGCVKLSALRTKSMGSVSSKPQLAAVVKRDSDRWVLENCSIRGGVTLPDDHA